MAKSKGGKRDNRPVPAPESDDGKVYISGKLLIVGVIALAVGGGAFSWWFRYNATHKAAQFWGPDAIRLVRDAPHVHLIAVGPMAPDAEHDHDDGGKFADHYHTLGGVIRVAQRHDVSKAPGLVHLRNELLMDRSFQVQPGAVTPADWTTGLEFRGSTDAPPLLVLFSADRRLMLRHPPERGANLGIPSERFADGLQTIFAEWQSKSPR